MDPTERMFNLYVVTQEEIAACDVDSLCAAIQSVLDDRAALNEFGGRIVIRVDGYKDDPRALFEIPEVRSFFVAFDARLPVWFWIVHPETRRIVTQCCIDGKNVRQGRIFSWTFLPSTLAPFVEKHIDAIGELEFHYGLTEPRLAECVGNPFADFGLDLPPRPLD